MISGEILETMAQSELLHAVHYPGKSHSADCEMKATSATVNDLFFASSIFRDLVQS